MNGKAYLDKIVVELFMKRTGNSLTRVYILDERKRTMRFICILNIKKKISENQIKRFIAHLSFVLAVCQISLGEFE